MSRSNGLVMLSGGQRASIERVLKPLPQVVKVIPVGVNTGYFSPRKRRSKPSESIEKYRLNDYSMRLIFVGRIDCSKGIDILLQAVRLIITEHAIPNLSLIIVGPTSMFGAPNSLKNPFAQRMIETIRTSQLKRHVILTGSVDVGELRELLLASDIFVLPSRFEAMPTALLEAMACGKPVIASNIKGIRDLVQTGVNGLLFEPGDPYDLRSKIIELSSGGEAEAMGANSREMAQKFFSWDIISRKMQNLYRSVIWN